MSNELVEQKNGGLVSAIENEGIGEILKPLVREIYLFDSFVAGTAHLSDRTVLDEIQEDDKLTLVREDDNRFDENAIMIRTENQKKLGYVPEKDNPVFARLMDAGKLLVGKIKKIEKTGSFTKISIGIYLVDF